MGSGMHTRNCVGFRANGFALIFVRQFRDSIGTLAIARAANDNLSTLRSVAVIRWGWLRKIGNHEFQDG